MQAIANHCKVMQGQKKNHFFPALRDDGKEPAVPKSDVGGGERRAKATQAY
jgi:hypothetical protein